MKYKLLTEKWESSAFFFFFFALRSQLAATRHRCVFLPDNGAFFVNYVITSSLIGTSMELLRVPALTVYAFRLCVAKSQAERIHVRRVRPSRPPPGFPPVPRVRADRTQTLLSGLCRVRPTSSSLAWSTLGPCASSQSV